MKSILVRSTLGLILVRAAAAGAVSRPEPGAVPPAPTGGGTGALSAALIIAGVVAAGLVAWYLIQRRNRRG